MAAAALHLASFSIASTNQHESHPMEKDLPSSSGYFKDCKTLAQLKQLHCLNTKKGLNGNSSFVNSLVSACSEMGTSESLGYAQKALELFIEDNGITGNPYMFNSLIRGYSSCGNYDKAIWVFHQMESVGVKPDKFTFPFLLSACTKSAAWSEGVQVHGSIVKMGFGKDLFVENSLIHLYGECGDIDCMRNVFDKMCERNAVSWTSLIGGYARKDCPKEAISLFFEMVELGVRPTPVTMVLVLSACAKLQDLELGEKVCGYIYDLGVEINTQVVNALVDLYMKCGAIDTAKQLFREGFEKNLVLCNTTMSNYVRNGLPTEALHVLAKMNQHGLRPDRVTMLSVASACSQMGHFSLGKCCHGYVLRNGLNGWDSICNALIDMYMKLGKQAMASKIFGLMPNKTIVTWNSLIAGFVRNGDVNSAWKYFNEMPESDLVSWNTMLGALVQESMFMEAIEFFHVMQSEGMEPDTVSMVGVASACGYLGSLDLAKWVHTYIKKKEIHCDMRLGTALVEMFSRCGDPQSAMQVFRKMVKRDVSAWTAAIGVMTMQGNGGGAIKLFNEMLRQGVRPDGVLFVRLLTSLSHSGLVKQGWKVFRSMKDTYGITPQVVHYGCMVDLLGRAGLVREALTLIQSMPMEPNEVIWGSLLASCRKQKNVKIAEYAADKIIKLDPDRTGTYVLLSNIYASAGKWTDVAKVRLQLKEQGVSKVPGSSSIDVNGKIYEFTSNDEYHSDMIHIKPMLEELNGRLSKAGHVPDLTNVLLNVEEYEKEHLLSQHSEKLAIAFALVSTSPGTTIRVVNNLRICSDCHSFAKLVSQIYNRDIIIQDNNRFHFFRQGVCSCKDFW